MSFNELNAIEHFIIQKLILLRSSSSGGQGGVSLNVADPTSSTVKEDAAVYGSFPWQFRSSAGLEMGMPSTASQAARRTFLDKSRKSEIEGIVRQMQVGEVNNG